MEELSELHKRGNTIIMVTHNPALTTYASRVIKMLDGKIDSDTKIPIVFETTIAKVPLSAHRTAKKPAVAPKPKKKPVKKTKAKAKK